MGTDAPTFGYLYAFDRTRGEVRWKLRFPHGVATDVLRRGDSVLFASEVGDVARVDTGSGDFVWRLDGKTGRSGADAEPRPLDPLLADGQLIVAWRSGAVDAYDADDGHLEWRRELGETLNASPLLVGGDVVVGTFAGRLLRLRATDGEVVSSFEVGGVLYGDLVATPDCLLVLSARGGFDPGEGMLGPHALICLRPDLSGALWLHRAPGMWGTFHPLVDGGTVVAGVEDRVLGLDLESGDLLWELAVRGLPRGLAVSGERLFVGTRPGPVLAFPWPQPGRRTRAPDSGDGAAAPSPG